LVFIKTKSNQIKIIFFKKNQNRFKPTGFGSVRFGFLEQKPVQTGLVWFFFVWLGFGSIFFQFSLVLARFGSFFFCFFQFGFGSVFSVSDL
jgi:hypothetical protein